METEGARKRPFLCYSLDMPRGVLRDKPLIKEEQFYAVSDDKLRLTVTALTDRYTEQVRDFIYRCYQDDKLAMIYRGIRMSQQFQKGRNAQRKIVEFPNPWVYDFCDTVMTNLYGKDWLKNNKALRHELIKPWHVVEKL